MRLEALEYTERRNPRSRNLDRMTIPEILRLINKEDHKLPLVVSKQVRRIARIVDQVCEVLQDGGRVFYAGAGTSGRLGVLDATEMPPTFGVPASRFQGVIAGGWIALRQSIEGAEDDERLAERQLEQRGLCRKDVLIGLSASGKTPFVLAAMRRAKKIGAKCFGITCNPNHMMARFAQGIVILDVGPEVIAGSSRMKCGTAQKMVLNMISTASMIRLGRASRGLMTDLQPKSRKLRQRGVRIVSELAEADKATAEKALEKAGGSIRLAVLSLKLGISMESARRILEKSKKP